MTESVPTGPTAKRRAPLSRYVLAAVLALVLAVGAGFLASRFRAEDPWLVGVVFAAAMVAPMYALTWFWLVSNFAIEEEPAHAEENVERRWVDRAAFGTYCDLLGTAGIALAVLSITGWHLSANVALLGVVLLGMADFAARYLLISRRES